MGSSQGQSQSQSQKTQSPTTDISSPVHAVDEVFDYASFLWDSGDFWQQVSPDNAANVGLNTHIMVGDLISQFICSPV